MWLLDESDEDQEDDWNYDLDVVELSLPCFTGQLRHFHYQAPHEDHLDWAERSANPILQHFTEEPARHLEIFELAGRGGIKLYRVKLNAFLSTNPWVKLVDLSGCEYLSGDEGELYINQRPSSLPALKYLRFAPPLQDIFTRDLPCLKSISIHSWGFAWLDHLRSAQFKSFPQVESFEIVVMIEPLRQKLLDGLPTKFPELRRLSLCFDGMASYDWRIGSWVQSVRICIS